jgi:phage terminase large subunit
MEINLEVTELQQLFIESPAFVTLFGGAAGGGKSYGLIIKCFLRSMRYAGYKSLILRRTFPELERSLVRKSLEIFPQNLGKYNESKHIWRFLNGSILEFGYCESENDVNKYQSAEYDAIGFDESTHFTEYQITYMISRIRGVNDFPRSLDLATNPGNVGHGFHKINIIDVLMPFQPGKITLGERQYDALFIPAKVQDNLFLMQSDPAYLERLDSLPETERRMLRDGDWDVFAGQFFPEFRRDIHVIRPFGIPDHWKRFRCMDYGLDMCAVYWVAIDPHNFLYVYRELYKSNFILSRAAETILQMTAPGEDISYTVASKDLWSRNKDTGKAEVETLIANGLKDIIEADNRRVPGWRELREWLMPRDAIDQDGRPCKRPMIYFFDTCINLIRTLPMLLHDEHHPEDASSEPHEVTHGPEALRYGIMSRPSPSRKSAPSLETQYLETLDHCSVEYAIKRKILDKMQGPQRQSTVRVDQYIKGQTKRRR